MREIQGYDMISEGADCMQLLQSVDQFNQLKEIRGVVLPKVLWPIKATYLFQESENIIGFNYKNSHLPLMDFLLSKDVSTRLLKKLYRRKRIYLNDQIYRKGLEPKEGDKIYLLLEDEKPDARPEKIDFNIIYN